MIKILVFAQGDIANERPSFSPYLELHCKLACFDKGRGKPTFCDEKKKINTYMRPQTALKTRVTRK